MAQTPNYGFVLGPEPPLPLKKTHYDYNWNLTDQLIFDLNGRVTALENTNFALADLSNVQDSTILTKLQNVDGSGSGLDADTLDGYQSATTPTANSIPVSDTNGYLNGWVNQGAGSGLDADTVDGYQTATTSSPNVIPVTGANGQLDKSFLPPLGVTGFKNRIINGDFSVWQRGTSFTAAGYTADRWRYDTDTDDAVSISQVATDGSEPFTAQYYARVGLTAGTTGAFNKFATRLEFPKFYFGKTVTLSFWAKADVAVAINAKLAFVFSGTEYSPVSQAVNVGTTWQRHTISFTLGTPTGFTESGGDYLDVAFLLPVNTTVTIDVANVQLEEGDTATDFEYVPYDVQLLRCMRYYEDSFYHREAGNNTTLLQLVTVQFTIPKRVIPTITVKDHLGAIGKVSLVYNSGSGSGGYTPTVYSITPKKFAVYAQDLFTGSNGIFFYWFADAEL